MTPPGTVFLACSCISSSERRDRNSSISACRLNLSHRSGRGSSRIFPEPILSTLVESIEQWAPPQQSQGQVDLPSLGWPGRSESASPSEVRSYKSQNARADSVRRSAWEVDDPGSEPMPAAKVGEAPVCGGSTSPTAEGSARGAFEGPDACLHAPVDAHRGTSPLGRNNVSAAGGGGSGSGAVGGTSDRLGRAGFDAADPDGVPVHKEVPSWRQRDPWGSMNESPVFEPEGTTPAAPSTGLASTGNALQGSLQPEGYLPGAAGTLL